MTADAPRAGVTLVVELRPGLAGLSSVVSVLHARLADVGDLSYAVSGEVAVLRVELGGTRLQALRLAAQVDRRVDVLSVAVLGPGASPARERVA